MKNNKIAIGLFTGIGVFTIMIVVYAYQTFFTPNISMFQDNTVLYIPKNATIYQVVDSLKKYKQLDDVLSFMFVSKVFGYHKNIKEGRYILRKEMNNLQAVRYLRSGEQIPLKVTFNNVRLKADLASKISKNLLLTSSDFLSSIEDQDTARKYGFTKETFGCMFLPDTYEMYWTIDVEGLLSRMQKEYGRFWNKDRLQKAKSLNMTPIKVSILASIVQAETIKGDEKARVAGVYINRIKKKMLLQADPTVIFALGDFSIKRVLNKHLVIDSPYNTYKYKGLPPGPIRIPSQSSINAVLNYEKHQYIYFCAKDDFSGYHTFAKSNKEHQRNAYKYRTALNKKRIMN